MDEKRGRYAEAGVDIDKGNQFVNQIGPIVGAVNVGNPGIIGGLGGFSGLFSLGGLGVDDPVLVSSTDGVGTKLAVAKMCGRHDTIGIDLVAMCVNDVVVCGAKPLFFLDYFSIGKLEVDLATEVVRGIAEGCKIAGCALIGGETAEMPGLYQPSDYDLAGFVVGIVDRSQIIDGSDIRRGDKIIGLASSGIHSNGYSLVRKIFFEEQGLSVNDHLNELGCTVGEELLRPTRIYVESILKVLRVCRIKGLVHNTGGSFVDNVPRILPANCQAIINPDTWPQRPIFSFLQERGGVSLEEMYRTFNMGIGMMVVVRPNLAEDVVAQLNHFGEKAFVIGEVGEGEQEVFIEGVL
jgi:phosphoribosylformylglycinamidine cyclo-ligase